MWATSFTVLLHVLLPLAASQTLYGDKGRFECFDGFRAVQDGRPGLPQLNLCAYVISDFQSCDRCCSVMHEGSTHNFLSSLTVSRQPSFSGRPAFHPPGTSPSRCWCCRPRKEADAL